MEKKDFITAVTRMVQRYIDREDHEDPDSQISVNPVTHFVDLVPAKDFLASLADSEEAIENAAYAFGGRDEEYTDFQASENPDFYPARSLVVYEDRKKPYPDAAAIEKLAETYFPS